MKCPLQPDFLAGLHLGMLPGGVGFWVLSTHSMKNSPEKFWTSRGKATLAPVWPRHFSKNCREPCHVLLSHPYLICFEQVRPTPASGSRSYPGMEELWSAESLTDLVRRLVVVDTAQVQTGK